MNESIKRKKSIERKRKRIFVLYVCTINSMPRWKRNLYARQAFRLAYSQKNNFFVIDWNHKANVLMGEWNNCLMQNMEMKQHFIFNTRVLGWKLLTGNRIIMLNTIDFIRVIQIRQKFKWMCRNNRMSISLFCTQNNNNVLKSIDGTFLNKNKKSEI